MSTNTVVCRYFKQGNCAFGSKCHFSHSIIDKRLITKREGHENTAQNVTTNSIEAIWESVIDKGDTVNNNNSNTDGVYFYGAPGTKVNSIFTPFLTFLCK